MFLMYTNLIVLVNTLKDVDALDNCGDHTEISCGVLHKVLGNF